MNQALNAIFDGTTFQLEEPPNLKPGTRVRIIVETVPDAQPRTFLQTAKSLCLQGEPDWSENVDHYLYGDIGSGDA
jgi:hypothetical protein